MAVVFLSGSYGYFGTGNGSVNKPAGVASGDMLIAILWGSNLTAGTISGGASWGSATAGTSGSNKRLSVFAKIADGTEPASYSCTYSAVGIYTHSAIILAFTGASATVTATFDNSQSSSASMDTPGGSIASGGYEARVLGTYSEDSLVNFVPASGSFTTLASGNQADAPFQAFGRIITGITPAINFAYTGSSIYADEGVTVTLAIAAGGPATQNVAPTAIASAEAFGSHTVTAIPPPTNVTAQAISSGEAFGTPALQLSIGPAGIPSAEAFGTAIVNNGLGIVPSGIPSSEAFGTPSLGFGLTAVGIPSSEAFGVPLVAVQQFITAVGIPSEEAFGTPVVFRDDSQDIIGAGGIGSSEAFGFATLNLPDVPVLIPPTIQETPMARNILHIRYGIDRGISIIQRWDNTYYTTRFPAQTDLEDAQKYYLGGYEWPLTPEERESLTAAGFGQYIVMRRKVNTGGYV